PSRVLPSPASPSTRTTRPRPARVSSRAAPSEDSSAARPISSGLEIRRLTPPVSPNEPADSIRSARLAGNHVPEDVLLPVRAIWLTVPRVYLVEHLPYRLRADELDHPLQRTRRTLAPPAGLQIRVDERAACLTRRVRLQPGPGQQSLDDSRLGDRQRGGRAGRRRS